MRTLNVLFLAAILSTVAATSHAALFETSDFPSTCAGSETIAVPVDLQGKFTDVSTAGWAEIGAAGFVRVDWKGFNFHSRGFAEKGYCVRQEIKELQNGATGIVLTIERSQEGTIGDSESYSMVVGFRKEKADYYMTSYSTGKIKLAFIPLGGTTAMQTEVTATRKAPAAEVAGTAATRKISSKN